MRFLLILLVILALGAGGAWYMAGREAGPSIEIQEPIAAIGQTGQVALLIDSPNGLLSRLEVSIEQNGARSSIFDFQGKEQESLLGPGNQRLRLVRPVGKRVFPQLMPGTARISVVAERPVLFWLRRARSTATRGIEVRLTPPQISVVSTHHYINQGGSEMVVYRVSPANASSGVRVGEYEYEGFPATGAGLEHADPALHVAFFALLWNQDVQTPIELYAHDDLGNASTAKFDYRVFPKQFRSSRIDINDRFLDKVVPEILRSPNAGSRQRSDMLTDFLVINRDERRQDNEQIAALAAKTAPVTLWRGPFEQLANTAVEGGFADQRTYFYQGKEVDRQVHLGFDLASTTNAPVAAANTGRVVHAGWLGIYGNCVILDHGMGLQSLYAHLSSIEVKVGDLVNQGDQLGRSGSTGLAAGDHLHFTTLLQGRPVTPIDWWSAKWVQDRITRKLQDAEALVTVGEVLPEKQNPDMARKSQ